MPPTVAETWAEYKDSLRVLIFGTLWAALHGLGPSLLIAWYDYENYEDPTDWQRLAWAFAAGAVGGVVGYWRKHAALLRLPPWFKGVPLEVQRALLANGVQPTK